MCSTAAQPRSIAVGADSTVFVAEIGVVEAIRSNQKVAELRPAFAPSAVASTGNIVAVGGEVCSGKTVFLLPVVNAIDRIRKCICMNGMERRSKISPH